jgi:hypothetical protein
VKLVPPWRCTVGRARWVTTKTGARNGGSSPHGTSPPSAMRLPMTYAPADSNISPMMSEFTSGSPPAKPWRSRHACASAAQRVTRKNPAASADANQSPSPSWRGPA